MPEPLTAILIASSAAGIAGTAFAGGAATIGAGDVDQDRGDVQEAMAARAPGVLGGKVLKRKPARLPGSFSKQGTLGSRSKAP